MAKIMMTMHVLSLNQIFEKHFRRTFRPWPWDFKTVSFALFVEHHLGLQDEEGSVIFPPEVGVAHCGSNSCSSSSSSTRTAANDLLFLLNNDLFVLQSPFFVKIVKIVKIVKSVKIVKLVSHTAANDLFFLLNNDLGLESVFDFC